MLLSDDQTKKQSMMTRRTIPVDERTARYGKSTLRWNAVSFHWPIQCQTISKRKDDMKANNAVHKNNEESTEGKPYKQANYAMKFTQRWNVAPSSLSACDKYDQLCNWPEVATCNRQLCAMKFTLRWNAVTPITRQKSYQQYETKRMARTIRQPANQAMKFTPRWNVVSLVTTQKDTFTAILYVRNIILRCMRDRTLRYMRSIH